MHNKVFILLTYIEHMIINIIINMKIKDNTLQEYYLDNKQITAKKAIKKDHS